jgi:tryptophanyl-tRNA synthetase
MVEQEKEFSVTMQSVTGRVNYDKLIQQFGTEKINELILERFAKATGKDLHPWLKRGIFFSHRDLGKFLDAYENGDPVFLYTGRGPSSDSMHIGHLIPFMFTKWLQDTFDCPLVIQLSDEEKYAFKKGTFKQLHTMGFENSKDIISVGFNPEKTFIFSNRDYRIACPKYEVFTSDLKVNASVKEVASVFGFKDTDNIGMYDWPFYQSAASFSQAFPHIFGGKPAFCLIPCAIDQDPYFRLGRDLAQKMNLLKTSTIYCTFLPPLTGLDNGKMSSSVGQESTLFLDDKEEVN